jgi:hypothetical protein
LKASQILDRSFIANIEGRAVPNVFRSYQVLVGSDCSKTVGLGKEFLITFELLFMGNIQVPNVFWSYQVLVGSDCSKTVGLGKEFLITFELLFMGNIQVHVVMYRFSCLTYIFLSVGFKGEWN